MEEWTWGVYGGPRGTARKINWFVFVAFCVIEFNKCDPSEEPAVRRTKSLLAQSCFNLTA